MEKTINEMVLEKTKLLNELRDLIDKTKSEHRGFSTTEETEFKEKLREIDMLKCQIDVALEQREMGKSTGRKTDLEIWDGHKRTVKAGEFRCLRKDEKLSEVFPVADKERRKFENLDFGKFIAAAAGKLGDCEERAALASTTDAAGGLLVPEFWSQQIWDYARNLSCVIQAGANTYPMRSAKELLPRLSQDTTGEWKAEGVEAGESTTAFAAIQLSSRTMFFWQPISEELWADCGMLGETLQRSIAENAALKLDAAALVGAGTDNEPLGIYYDSTDITQTAATNATNYWDDIADQIYRLENANHSPTACIMSPRSRSLLRKLKDGEGRYYPVPDFAPQVFSTKQIPDTFDTNHSAIITGDFTNLIVGIRNELTIAVLKEVKARNYQVVLCGALRADIGIIRPAAFDVITGVSSTWA